MSQRGHTLYELMISLVLIGILAGLTATLAASTREDDRLARGYVEDLRHLRDASDLLASEVRSARDVTATEDGLRIDGERWCVRDGALLRGGAVAVRGLSRIDVERTADGAWRIGLAPVPRRAASSPPLLIATARPRVEARR